MELSRFRRNLSRPERDAECQLNRRFQKKNRSMSAPCVDVELPVIVLEKPATPVDVVSHETKRTWTSPPSLK
jgi:hypothetical protein